jgi:hypothetical protein
MLLDIGIGIGPQRRADATEQLPPDDFGLGE